MNLNQRNKIKIEGGMASMTDLVFLLLIFFIILSLMANNQTPLDLPQANENTKTDPERITPTVIVLNRIPKEGENQKLYQVAQEGQPLSGLLDYESMKSEISKAVTASGKTKVRIAGEKTAYYDAVFQVLILAQSQEWQPVLAFDK